MLKIRKPKRQSKESKPYIHSFNPYIDIDKIWKKIITSLPRLTTAIDFHLKDPRQFSVDFRNITNNNIPTRHVSSLIVYNMLDNPYDSIKSLLDARQRTARGDLLGRCAKITLSGHWDKNYYQKNDWTGRVDLEKTPLELLRPQQIFNNRDTLMLRVYKKNGGFILYTVTNIEINSIKPIPAGIPVRVIPHYNSVPNRVQNRLSGRESYANLVKPHNTLRNLNICQLVNRYHSSTFSSL